MVPGVAWALVNHRVHPSQSLQEVVEHDILAINDPSINVSAPRGGGEMKLVTRTPFVFGARTTVSQDVQT